MGKTDKDNKSEYSDVEKRVKRVKCCLSCCSCCVPKQYKGHTNDEKLPSYARVLRLEEAEANPMLVAEVIECAIKGFCGTKLVEGEPTSDWTIGKTTPMSENPEGDVGREDKQRNELKKKFKSNKNFGHTIFA